MKPTFIGITLAAAFLLVGCGTTSESSINQSQLATSVELDDVVCKNVIRTGTRFGTRVCLTNRDWQAKREAAREAAEHIQRKGVQTGNPQGE